MGREPKGKQSIRAHLWLEISGWGRTAIQAVIALLRDGPLF